MRQTWNHVTFLHWPYDPGRIRPLVPRELALDLYDGAAWVGLVPFFITDLTAPHAPALPWISAFPETNVRTYVLDHKGRRGVYFFSLDAARLAAVVGARLTYGLRYFWARMNMEASERAFEYRSRRILRRGHTQIRVEQGEPIAEPSELEVFLTARFRLYARWFGIPVMARAEHPQWPLHRARVIELTDSLVRAAGIREPTGEPLAHYARRVDVRIGPPERP